MAVIGVFVETVANGDRRCEFVAGPTGLSPECGHALGDVPARKPTGVDGTEQVGAAVWERFVGTTSEAVLSSTPRSNA
ncbi:hypothetical protein [Nocardia sp. NPDC057455]|uniref:hypothetical protein n=1 Tax=Nocardia sp. NPDC057455 TaxID=3346138 RepID=UPI0036731B55